MATVSGYLWNNAAHFTSDLPIRRAEKASDAAHLSCSAIQCLWWAPRYARLLPEQGNEITQANRVTVKQTEYEELGVIGRLTAPDLSSICRSF